MCAAVLAHTHKNTHLSDSLLVRNAARCATSASESASRPSTTTCACVCVCVVSWLAGVRRPRRRRRSAVLRALAHTAHTQNHAAHLRDQLHGGAARVVVLVVEQALLERSDLASCCVCVGEARLCAAVKRPQRLRRVAAPPSPQRSHSRLTSARMPPLPSSATMRSRAAAAAAASPAEKWAATSVAMAEDAAALAIEEEDQKKEST